MSASTSGCTTDPVELELATWWQSPAEKRALDVLKREHGNLHPEVRFDAPPDVNVVTQRAVQQKLVHGSPPDSFQTNIGMGLLQWADMKIRQLAGGSRLESVSHLVRGRQFHPDLLKNLTFAGQVYGIPINIHRTNVLYFDASRRIGGQPFTLAELCPADGVSVAPLNKDGTRPKMALTLDQDWYVRAFVLENLLPAVGGADLYERLFCQHEDCPTDTTPFDALRDKLTRVLNCARDLHRHVEICAVGAPDDPCGIDSSVPAWVAPVQAVAKGEADFTVGGDWANGELANDRTGNDLRNGTVASQPFPTLGEKIFVFTSDVFPLPASAPHPAEAEDLLRTLLSPSFQTAFSEQKGSIPALRNVTLAGDSSHAEQHRPEDGFEAPGMRRLLATSGLLPPVYPRALADNLRILLTPGSEGDDEAFHAAMRCLEVGFGQVKTWAKHFRAGR